LVINKDLKKRMKKIKYKRYKNKLNVFGFELYLLTIIITKKINYFSSIIKKKKQTHHISRCIDDIPFSPRIVFRIYHQIKIEYNMYNTVTYSTPNLQRR